MLSEEKVQMKFGYLKINYIYLDLMNFKRENIFCILKDINYLIANNGTSSKV